MRSCHSKQPLLNFWPVPKFDVDPKQRGLTVWLDVSLQCFTSMQNCRCLTCLSHLGSGYFFRTLYLSTGPKGLPRSFSASCSKQFIRIRILHPKTWLPELRGRKESFCWKKTTPVLSWADMSCLKEASRERGPGTIGLLCTINECWSARATKIGSRGRKQSKLRRIRSLVGGGRRNDGRLRPLCFNNSGLTSSPSIHRIVCNQITAMIAAQKPALRNDPFFAQSSSKMSR